MSSNVGPTWAHACKDYAKVQPVGAAVHPFHLCRPAVKHFAAGPGGSVWAAPPAHLSGAGWLAQKAAEASAGA